MEVLKTVKEERRNELANVLDSFKDTMALLLVQTEGYYESQQGRVEKIIRILRRNEK